MQTKNEVLEALAEIADETGDDYSRRAEYFSIKARDLMSQARKLNRSIQRGEKILRIEQKAAPIFIVGSVVLGVTLGQILGISQIHRFYGPITTVLETIGALTVCLVLSGVFAAVLSWLMREHFLGIVEENNGLLGLRHRKLAMLEAKRAEILADVESLRKMARNKRFEAMRFRGVI